MIIHIKLNKEDKRIVKKYAKLNNFSPDVLMKNAFFEKVEDEYDIALANNILKDYKDNPKAYSLEEIKKMLEL